MKKIVIILSAIMLSWTAVSALTPTDKKTTSENGKTTVVPKKDSKEITYTENAGKDTVVTKETVTRDTLTADDKPKRLDAKPKNKDLSWESSDTTIVRVTNQGEVIPKKEGNVIITAKTDDGETDTWEITVNPSYKDLLAQVSKLTESISDLNEEIATHNEQIERKKPLIPEYVSYILAGLVLVLLALLFLFNKKIGSNKKEIAELIKRKDHHKSIVAINDDKLVKMQSENTDLKEKIKELQGIIYQNQQSRKANDDSKPAYSPPQGPQSLYADAIINGKFNRVKDLPNADTIFELKLSKPGEARANVVIYEGAYQLVKQRPEFLEGCEKQILGSDIVEMLHEGAAQKDGNGNWIITTTPEVKIS